MYQNKPLGHGGTLRARISRLLTAAVFVSLSLPVAGEADREQDGAGGDGADRGTPKDSAADLHAEVL